MGSIRTRTEEWTNSKIFEIKMSILQKLKIFFHKNIPMYIFSLLISTSFLKEKWFDCSLYTSWTAILPRWPIYFSAMSMGNTIYAQLSFRDINDMRQLQMAPHVMVRLAKNRSGYCRLGIWGLIFLFKCLLCSTFWWTGIRYFCWVQLHTLYNTRDFS